MKIQIEQNNKSSNQNIKNKSVKLEGSIIAFVISVFVNIIILITILTTIVVDRTGNTIVLEDSILWFLLVIGGISILLNLVSFIFLTIAIKENANEIEIIKNQIINKENNIENNY